MGKKLAFTVKDAPGLNNPVIKVSNGDEIVVTGMSYNDIGKNRKNLRTTSEMTDHYTEDFELLGVGGKKYLVTREVTIFDPTAKVKGGRFKSEIVSVSLLENVEIKPSVNSVVYNILSGTPVREALLSEVSLEDASNETLTETRKFKVGEKFKFKDKYGSWYECTVLDKDLFDEMDYDDYAIGTMTFSYPTMGNPHKETVRIFKSEQSDSYGDEYFVSDVTKAQNGWGIASWAFPN